MLLFFSFLFSPPIRIILTIRTWSKRLNLLWLRKWERHIKRLNLSLLTSAPHKQMLIITPAVPCDCGLAQSIKLLLHPCHCNNIVAIGSTVLKALQMWSYCGGHAYYCNSSHTCYWQHYQWYCKWDKKRKSLTEMYTVTWVQYWCRPIGL